MVSYVSVDNDEELNELKCILFGTTNLILINQYNNLKIYINI